MSDNCAINEIETVVNSILFLNIGHVKPLFCSADTRSRKTKTVNVWSCTRKLNFPFDGQSLTMV